MADKLFQDVAEDAFAGYVLVAPERGIDSAGGGLTYGVPATLWPMRVGERVLVPLGRGNAKETGYVIDVPAEPGVEPGKLKAVIARESGAALPDDLVELARWVSRYYHAPVGMVFAAMLPAAVTRGVGLTRRTEVRRSIASLASLDDAIQPTRLQRAVLDAATEWTDVKAAMAAAGAKTRGPVHKLIEAGLLERRTVEEVRGGLETQARAATPGDTPPTLNPDQAAAVEAITAALGSRFASFVLHGVTGSGKTEVYLRVIAEALRRGRTAIVLVPEIALTPQTVGRFLARFDAAGSDERAADGTTESASFGDPTASAHASRAEFANPPRGVAVLHSGLTAAQRHAQWRRIRDGRAGVVVGARSAVFAPLERLGVIVVDEEHDTSYKQDQLPRYHARDVAIRRAQQHGACVVLGSATPSLESYHNAGGGGAQAGSHPPASGHTAAATSSDAAATHAAARFRLLSLPRRAPGLTLPRVELVDLTEERRRRRGVHLLSQRLERELELCTLIPRSRGQTPGQAMILLNRRGYANYIACPDHRCGWLMMCDHCDATMVYHTRGGEDPHGSAAAVPRGLVRCHHCEAERVLPGGCPNCGKAITLFGLGTQRVEKELGEKLPGLRVVRMDSDAMRTGKAYHDTLSAFGRGEIDVLLGTQMIAKGLDFAGVRLVGVVCADTALHLPDFRAAERTFQLVAQVTGRAGRGDAPSRAIVQSFNPAEPTITAACQGDYAAFASRELELRAGAGLPPIGRMARIVMRDVDPVKLTARARSVASGIATIEQNLRTGVRLRGPVVSPIARIADFHRQQVELLGPDAASVQRLLTACRNRLSLVSDRATAVDVDPVSAL